MADSGRKIPVKVRMAVIIALATAIALIFHMADVPLSKGALLGLTAVATLLVEGFAFVYAMMNKPRVARP